jgi:hypothetical protein
MIKDGDERFLDHLISILPPPDRDRTEVSEGSEGSAGAAI